MFCLHAEITLAKLLYRFSFDVFLLLFGYIFSQRKYNAPHVDTLCVAFVRRVCVCITALLF